MHLFECFFLTLKNKIMKNLFFILLLLSTFLVSCNQKEDLVEMTPSEITTTEVQARGLNEQRCPRQDLQTPELAGAVTLANELTQVINCGNYIALPSCNNTPENVFTETVTDVLVAEWCVVSGNGCPCTYFPDNFTIADQDVLIAQAEELVGRALRVCGSDNASYSFHTSNSAVSYPNTNCEGIKIELFVSATSVCCAAFE